MHTVILVISWGTHNNHKATQFESYYPLHGPYNIPNICMAYSFFQLCKRGDLNIWQY